MKTRSYYQHGLLVILLLLVFLMPTSCKKDDPTIAPVANKEMDQLNIPENFYFETTKEVTINFQDQLKSGGMARYDVFYHSTRVVDDTITYINSDGVEVTEIVPRYDETNDLIARKISETGFFSLLVSVPSYITELYVIKNELGIFTSSIIQVNGNSASFKAGLKDGSSLTTDIIWGVNDSGDIFTIDPLSGSLTIKGSLPQGSNGCAIDRKNGILYFVGKLPQYPLYKYNLTTNTSTLVANLNMKVHRLEYNANDGLLYANYREDFYTVDPSNGKILTQKKIYNLDNKEFGDINVTENGKWYLASYSGLYWLEFKTEKVYAHRISQENLPFKPTAMTILSNGEVWLANHNAHSQLIKMNKDNGTWQYMFNPLNIGIDDFATYTTDEPQIIVDDADGDGIIDYYDEYPYDPLRAYNTYTPSILGLGSLSFEDMWPTKGDYDFNDLLLNYQFKTVMNAQDKIVEIYCKFVVKNVGGIYHNGFGFEIPCSPSLISSVTGYNLTSSLISLDAKGLETGQTNAVVIVFDDAQENIYQTINILVKFDQPQNPSVVGTPPFNPFIFINKDRGREVHLINMKPTNKMNTAYFNTQDDKSNPAQGKYYSTVNKLPWSLNLLDAFAIPKEGKQVNKAYTKFNEWAESGGTLFPDWYKSVPGYRNLAYINVSSK